MPDHVIPAAVLDGNNQIISRPLTAIQQAAIGDWMNEHIESLRAALAPHDLDPLAILAPNYRRVVTKDELERQAVLAIDLSPLVGVTAINATIAGAL